MPDPRSQWGSHAQRESSASFFSGTPPPNRMGLGAPTGTSFRKQQQGPGHPALQTHSSHVAFGTTTHVGAWVSVSLSFPGRILVGTSKRPWGRMGPQHELTPHPQLSALLPEVLKSLLESGSLESPELIILLVDGHRCARPWSFCWSHQLLSIQQQSIASNLKVAWNFPLSALICFVHMDIL